MGYKKRSGLIAFTTVLLTMLLLCGFASTDAYMSQSTEQKIEATSDDNTHIQLKTDGTNEIVEIDIPQITLNNNFRPVEHVFIESVVLYPGDTISYDISTDNKNQVFLGLTTDRATFLTLEQEYMNIMGGVEKASGTYTVENENHYMYVFAVHNPADGGNRNTELEVTYLKGSVTIERASEN